MTPINKSQFANQCGFSRQFIVKLLKKKPPVVDIAIHNGKEHIDLDGVNTQYFLSTRGASVKPPPPKPAKPKTKTPPPKTHTKIKKNLVVKPPKQKPTVKKSLSVQPPETPPPPQDILTHTPDETKQNNPSGNNGSPNHKDKHELDKDRIKETIEKLRIDNEKRRGELIPKKLVAKVFSRLHTIDANQFKTLGVSVSPKINGVYNSANTKKTKEILELFDCKKDKELKKTINKILNDGTPDRIREMNKIFEDQTGGILQAIHRENEKFLKSIETLKEL